MYDELGEWVEKKAIEQNKAVESVENINLVYVFAQDFKDYNSRYKFLLTRNYGEKKFKMFGKEILEIFRKYQ